MNIVRAAGVLSLWAVATVINAEPLPALQVQDLDHHTVALPNTPGKITVLTIGFSQTGGTRVRAWFRQLRIDLGSDPHVALEQLAVLRDVPGLFLPLVMAGIEKGVPVEERSQFLTTVHDEARWKALVGLRNADVPAVVVVDQRGEVRLVVDSVLNPTSYPPVLSRVRALAGSPQGGNSP